MKLIVEQRQNETMALFGRLTGVDVSTTDTLRMAVDIPTLLKVGSMQRGLPSHCQLASLPSLSLPACLLPLPLIHS